MFYQSSLKIIFLTMFFSFLAVLLLKKIAKPLGLIDYPGGRKNHEDQTPLIGGIGIFLGLSVAAHFLPVPESMYHHAIVGSFVLLFLGAIDDRFDISPGSRLFTQLGTILYLIFIGHHGISYIGGVFYLSDVHLGLLMIPLTMVLMLGFINAINMLDGQDGLAGSIVLTEASLLCIVSFWVGEEGMGLLLIALIAMLIVFLSFNFPLKFRPHAKVFLGDSGSNFLAFFIAWSVIYLSQVESQTFSPITLIWIVALPFFDMTSACLKRSRQGRSWANAGHDHIHHVLKNKNVSKIRSTLMISFLSFLLGATGLILAYYKISEGFQSYLFLFCYITYILIMNKLDNHKKSSKKMPKIA